MRGQSFHSNNTVDSFCRASAMDMRDLAIGCVSVCLSVTHWY